MARTSSVYDQFIIWTGSVTLTFNLAKQMFQMALEHPCKIILKSMHKCRSYSPDKLIYVTLTFNQPEKLFQMALLLLKDNNMSNNFEIHP